MNISPDIRAPLLQLLGAFHARRAKLDARVANFDAHIAIIGARAPVFPPQALKFAATRRPPRAARLETPRARGELRGASTSRGHVRVRLRGTRVEHRDTCGGHRHAPDFFPKPQFNLKTPQSLKPMPKSSSINPADEAFGTQMQNFKNAIGGYATILDLSPATVTAQADDADYFSNTLQNQQTMLGGSRQWTAWKDLIRDGGDLPPSGAPVAPILSIPLASVAPGIEPRFRALVKQIKAHPSYNVAMGQALGIEGAQQTGPDFATVQPDISATISGTHVEIGWNWGGFANFLDQLELEVDRGQGFALLAIDTTPGYTDTQPFPAAPAKWTYRAIYRVGDSRVGQWSKPVSVTVGG